MVVERERVFLVMGQQVGVFELVLMESESGSWMYKQCRVLRRCGRRRGLGLRSG